MPFVAADMAADVPWKYVPRPSVSILDPNADTGADEPDWLF